jgi:branched-subunit amino acid ABC-type transport system permease component
MGFFLETLIGGLMAGMLYSLVALGFVLIYNCLLYTSDAADEMD